MNACSKNATKRKGRDGFTEKDTTSNKKSANKLFKAFTLAITVKTCTHTHTHTLRPRLLQTLSLVQWKEKQEHTSAFSDNYHKRRPARRFCDVRKIS